MHNALYSKKRTRWNTTERSCCWPWILTSVAPATSLSPSLSSTFSLKKINFPPSLMPSLSIPMTKQWRKVDKDALYHQLIVEGKVDIKDLSSKSIDAVHSCYFPHWTNCNFWHNFKDFAATFDLELLFDKIIPIQAW